MRATITDDNGDVIGRMDFRKVKDDGPPYFLATIAVQVGGGDTAMHSIVIEGFNDARLNALALVQAALDELPEDALRAQAPALLAEPENNGLLWPRLWMLGLGR